MDAVCGRGSSEHKYVQCWWGAEEAEEGAIFRGGYGAVHYNCSQSEYVVFAL